MRVNLGSGQAYMAGWLNVDASPGVHADVHLDAIEFVRRHGPEADELYMGHFLEHLMHEDARALLLLLNERLPEGAVVSAVTPDIRAIFRAYEAGDVDSRELNELFIYSYVQPSHHLWCYDTDSLGELFRSAGFASVEVIDPLTWDPVYWKSGPESRFQCGVSGRVTRAARHDLSPDVPAQVGRVPGPSAEADSNGHLAGHANGVSGVAAIVEPTAEDILLDRVEGLRRDNERLRARAREADELQYENADLRARLHELHLRHEAVHRSASFRVGYAIRQAAVRVMPPESTAGRAARSAARRLVTTAKR